MTFEDLLKYESPKSFPLGTIYWQFSLGNLVPSELKRQGNIGYYSHDDQRSNRTFRFDDFDRFREAYIAAHEENIRRLRENKGPLLEIGEMQSGDWPPWGKDNCG